ncbi:MAG: serine/threonine protein kinase [Myxococcales bacterium]|nr:serine/threonine protein kinase [Myxococcales bacterium]
MSYQTADSTAPARLGRYELIGQLATGGMAEIHLARLAGEAGFEKIVVLKRLLPELVASKAFVEMFLDEGKLVSRLDHPNICEVYELGRDGAEYFLVMPFLDGVPAADLIARPRESDRIAQIRVAAGVIAQASAGLHHAHEQRGADGAPLGLVHRDVSPSNLFVTAAGVVKVLDFGVAKVRGASETEAGTIKGKTQYMAPEQLLGEPLDRRCDVFALGIVLYELATHQRLFKRASDYLSARAILEDPIPRADEADPTIPRQLADVIVRALSRRRDDRFSDARALASAIEAAMVTYGGVATGPTIAAALSESHGDELTAKRTRQLHVLDEARSRTGRGRPATAHGRDPASNVATLPRSRGIRSRTRWFAVGLAGVVVTVTVVVLGLVGHDSNGRGSDGRSSDNRSSDGRISDNRRSDGRISDNRGSDGRVSDNRGSDGPGSNGPGSNGRGSDGRSSDGGGSDGRGSDGRISGGRGSDAGISDGRGSDTRSDGPRSVSHSDASLTHGSARGTFSIDSKPFAVIFVDDQELGVTPIVHRALGAGRHRVKAVLQDGRHKELSITVPAGRAAAAINLTW